MLFVICEQLLLLFLPGAGRHPGLIVEGLHWCYSRLWWWFDTSTQSPQLATPPAQQKWKANGCRKNTKPIVFITSSGHKNCEWGKVLQEWHQINQYFIPRLLKHVGLSFICLAFRLLCTVYGTFPSALLLLDNFCCMYSDLATILTCYWIPVPCLFWVPCYCTFHTLIPACSVLYVPNSFWVWNSVKIATVLRTIVMIVTVLFCDPWQSDIPSWILKDDRKSRSLEPNIFKFNGVRLIFMFVLY